MRWPDRPVLRVSRYNQVSAEFWNAVHATLSGDGDAKTNLAGLEKTLERVSRGGIWRGGH